MAEEQTQTAEPAQYGQSFFENFELVDQSSGNAVEGGDNALIRSLMPQQGQAADGQDPQVPGQAQPAPQQPAAAPGAAQAPATPTPTPEPGIADAFFKTDAAGNRTFDAESAMGFLQPQAAQPAPQVPGAPVAPGPAQQPAQPAQPAAPEPTYEESLRSNLSIPLQSIKSLMQQGYTAEQAVQLAEKNLNEFIDRHLLDRRFQEMDGKLTAKEKELEAQREAVTLLPKAENNLMEVSQQFAKNMPPEKFKDAIFNPKYGGQLINAMFDAQNPDKKGFQGEKLQKAMGDWWIKFASNKDNLMMVAQVAQSAIQREMMPSIIEHVRSIERKLVQQGAEAQTRAPSGVPATPQQTGGARTTGYESLDRMIYGPQTQ